MFQCSRSSGSFAACSRHVPAGLFSRPTNLIGQKFEVPAERLNNRRYFRAVRQQLVQKNGHKFETNFQGCVHITGRWRTSQNPRTRVSGEVRSVPARTSCWFSRNLDENHQNERPARSCPPGLVGSAAQPDCSLTASLIVCSRPPCTVMQSLSRVCVSGDLDAHGSGSAEETPRRCLQARPKQ